MSAALFPKMARAQTAEVNSCMECHLDKAEDVQGSIHTQNQISCHHCHGGDPSEYDPDAAMAPEAGFIGVPDKKATAGICGGCHSDVEFMNFYGIPTDQLARYKTSIHGKRLFDYGDTNVAVCSDCHGSHNVTAVTDPASPVYPLNLPRTCNHCHGDGRLMASYDLPTDIFETYQSSVHGRALFEKKDLGVAQCASCHGSHGAVPPGVKEVSATCGKCHLNEKKYFQESVHAQVPGGNFSECISCHGFHGVRHPTAALYDQACIKCHDKGSQAVSVGQQIAHFVQESEYRLSFADGLVKQASIEGIFVEEEAASLEEAKTDVIELGPLQHSLSLEKISELHGKASAVTEEIKDGIAKKRKALRWRKIALVPLWIFVGIMVMALRLRYKELKREQHGKDS